MRRLGKDECKEEWGSMRLTTYQAQLSLPASLARVRAARTEIERAGGRLEMTPTDVAGLTTVRIHLPERYHPEHFVPGLPFYPV